jgi:homoserine O-acetyltransferase
MPPKDGLSIARMIGHLSYLSDVAFEFKFSRRRQVPRMEDRGGRAEVFEVESYLSYQGDRFNDRFDANSLVMLSNAIDGYDCRSLAGSNTEFLVVSFTSDWIYPPAQSKEIHEAAVDAGCRSEWHNLDLPGGHDSFLLDGTHQGELFRSFLAS